MGCRTGMTQYGMPWHPWQDAAPLFSENLSEFLYRYLWVFGSSNALLLTAVPRVGLLHMHQHIFRPNMYAAYTPHASGQVLSRPWWLLRWCIIHPMSHDWTMSYMQHATAVNVELRFCGASKFGSWGDSRIAGMQLVIWEEPSTQKYVSAFDDLM